MILIMKTDDSNGADFHTCFKMALFFAVRPTIYISSVIYQKHLCKLYLSFNSC